MSPLLGVDQLAAASGRAAIKTLTVVAGNIAAGKTLLLLGLDDTGAFTVIPEPVEVWQTGYADNFLALHYGNPTRWAFTLQILAFVTRVKVQEHALAQGPGRYVMERCILDDRRIFARLLYESGDMTQSEYRLYCNLWDYMARDVVRPDHIFYLRTPAATCLERIARRGRPEEAEIELEFLDRLEEMYDKWLLKRAGVTVLDGLKTTDKLVADVMRAINNE